MLSIRQLLNPLGKEQYKIDTEQSNLNQLLFDKLVEKSKSLKSLRLIIAPRILHIRGVIRQPDGIAAKLKFGDVHFDIGFSKVEIKQHDIILEIKRFKVFNPHKRIDLLRIINYFSHVLRDKILEGFTGGSSPFTVVEHRHKLKFDLNFVLRKLPDEIKMFGEFSIRNISFEKKKIVWYVYSNLMIKGMIEWLGPNYIQVQKVNFAEDAIKLLTDLTLDI